jgi:hypothetical protein
MSENEAPTPAVGAGADRRSPLPSAGEIDEWIKQRLAEFDEQRRRGQQNGSTDTTPPASNAEGDRRRRAI